MSELLKKYESIDQSKLNEGAIKILNRVKTITSDFTTDDAKNNKIAEDVLNEIMKKYPDSVKIVKRTSKTKPAPKKVAKAKKPATTSTAKKSGNNIMSVAKEIQKAGESWKDAMERAKQVLKERREQVIQKQKTELEKLYALVKTKKELQGFAKSDIQRDAVRDAKPRGARVVTKEGSTSNQYGTFRNKLGRKYWETRDRHADRLAPNYPKDMPLLANGGGIRSKEELEKIFSEKEAIVKNLTPKEIAELWNKNSFGVKEGVSKPMTIEQAKIPDMRIYLRNLLIENELTEDEQAKYFADGGSVSNERMYNFLKDDLAQLEEAIKSGDMEEVNRFFSYWLGSSNHLKSLETKTNERMYNFLKDDLEKLEIAVENNDTEEVERFFSYWGQHLESLKMANGGSLQYLTDPNFGNFQNTGAFEKGGNIDGTMTFYQNDYDKLIGDSSEDYPFFSVKSGSYWEIKKDKDEKTVAKWFPKSSLLKITRPQDKDLVEWLNRNSYLSQDEYEKFELGGAFMTTDLAGHSGGGTGGLNANLPLNGFSGTNYTGLVGETGAMSSGELFMDGGAVVQNQQVIDGASQSYVNYYLANDGISQASYKDGGAIENQYEGKTPEEIWNSLSKQQRGHFLYDHVREIEEYKNIERLPSSEIIKAYNSEWSSLDKDIKNRFANHTREGQYASGGVMEKNQQVIDDASQSYINYYLGEGASQGIYKDGGSLGEELMGGQSNSTLKPSGYHLVSAKGREIIVSDDGGNSKERWVKNNGFSGYRLVYKGNYYEFTDSFEGGGFTPDVSDGTQFMSGVYADGGGLDDVKINPENFSLKEIDDLTDVKVVSVWKGIRKADFFNENAERVYDGFRDDIKKIESLRFSVIRNSANVKIGHGNGDSLFLEMIAYLSNKKNDETPYYIEIYTKKGNVSVKKLANHFISKMENGGGIRSKEELKKIFSEKEAIVKNLTPKQIAEMWNENSFGVKEGISKPITIEEAKRPSMKIYLENLLIENELTEEEQAKYFAKGGSVDDSIIDELFNGYASAVLFTETDSDSGEPLDSEYSISDFDKETVTSTKKMLAEFYSKNKEAIEESELDLFTIGNDVWYTRSGQGAGFFDHSLDSEVEEKLTKGAKALGEYPSVETYDGKISIRGVRTFAKGGFTPDVSDGTQFMSEAYAYGGRTKSRPSMRELYIENIAFATNTRTAGVDAFAKEHNLTDSELSNLMTGIGRKMISQSDFITALVGNKNNPKQKEVVAFAKSDKAYKMADGGDVLPPSKTYGENIYKAMQKFNISDSEARKRYGQFTINQWNELLEEKMADGGALNKDNVKVGDILVAKTGVKVKVVEFDPKFGGRVKVIRLDKYSTGKPSVFTPLSSFTHKVEVKKTKKELREEELESISEKVYEVWEKIGADSGGQIRADEKLLREYAEGTEKVMQKNNIKKGSFNQSDYDFYVDVNDHLLNDFLVFNGYYNDSVTKNETGWRIKNFEQEIKERGKAVYVANPDVITVGLKTNSSSKPKKYIDHDDIKSVTLKLKGKVVTIAGKDVLNGANLMEKGGDLSKIANYVPKRDVVEVELKDGSKVKPVNGYWVKKGAEPLSTPNTKTSTSNDDITADLEKFNIDNLDDYETMQYNHFLPKLGKVQSLQLLINTVEGDVTQLSPELAKLAEKQGSSYADGGFMNNVYAKGGSLNVWEERELKTFVNSLFNRAKNKIANDKGNSLFVLSNTVIATKDSLGNPSFYLGVKKVQNSRPTYVVGSGFLSSDMLVYESYKKDSRFLETQSIVEAKKFLTDKVKKQILHLRNRSVMADGGFMNDVYAKGGMVVYLDGEKSKSFKTKKSLYEFVRSQAGTGVKKVEIDYGNRIIPTFDTYLIEDGKLVHKGELIQKNYDKEEAEKRRVATERSINQMIGYAKGGELTGSFLAEIKVPYNYENVVRDEFEFTEFLSKALTKKWFGNGVWGVSVVKPLFEKDYSQKIVVKIDIPVGVTQGGGLDKFDVLEFMSKTLTKKWFGNGIWGVDIVKKFADGGNVSDYLNSPEYQKMVADFRKLQHEVKMSVVKAVGLDSAIEFYQTYTPIRPFQLLEKAVRSGFITLDEINQQVVDSAMEVAEDSEDMDEVGSSDMTYAMKDFLEEAGFQVNFVDGRLTRTFADGGSFFEDNDGFMKADNEFNYRYINREPKIDVLDEEIDLTSNFEPRRMVTDFSPENEEIDLSDDGRVRVIMTQSNRGSAENFGKINPRAFEFIDLPMPTSNKHKND